MPTLISRKTVDSDISESIDLGVSQSEFAAYDLCHYRWYLEKVKMLTSIRPEFILSVGTSFHHGMDWMYRTLGKKIGVPPLKFNKLAKLTPEEEEEAMYWHKVLTILIEAYLVHYKRDFENLQVIALEQVLKVSFQGINLCGALDLGTEHNKAVQIWDHKTKSMRGSTTGGIDEWKTRFQFLLYTFMWNKLNPDQRVRYFLVNVVHKPALRRKQNETPQALLRRIKDDVVARKTEYFYRERLPLTSDLLQAFENHFLRPKIENFKMLQQTKPDPNNAQFQALVLQRNSANCWAYGRQCPFYAHCHTGKKLEQLPHLVKRKAKHEHYEEKAD
jgi:hypothetical protein